METKKKKNFPIWLLIIILPVLLLSRVIGGEMGKEIAGQDSSEKVSPTGLTDVQKEAHVKACTQQGASKGYCECTFNKIKDLYTVQDLQRLAKETQSTGKLDSGFIKAAQDCQYLR